MAKVLIVEDHPALRILMSEIVMEAGHEVVSAVSNGVDGLTAYVKMKPDLMIVDYQMPLMNGIALIERVMAIQPKQKILMCSAEINPTDLNARVKASIPMIRKPFDYNHFIQIMNLTLADTE